MTRFLRYRVREARLDAASDARNAVPRQATCLVPVGRGFPTLIPPVATRQGVGFLGVKGGVDGKTSAQDEAAGNRQIVPWRAEWCRTGLCKVLEP